MIGLLRRLTGRLPAVNGFGRTDTGRVRSGNEDSFALLADRNLFLVADGMGGHRAGEVASAMAIGEMTRLCTAAALARITTTAQETEHFLLRAFRQTNEKVMAAAVADPDRAGMGCTLLATLIAGDTAHVCHVGDSRCYLVRDGDAMRITTDHSSGESSRHVLTRSIGFPFTVDPEYRVLAVRSGDRLLLCTDGLWSMVEDGRIAAIIGAATSPEDACDRLVDAANVAGGLDNITALVIAIGN